MLMVSNNLVVNFDHKPVGQADDGFDPIADGPLVDANLVGAISFLDADGTGADFYNIIVAIGAIDPEGVGFFNPFQINGTDDLVIEVDFGDVALGLPVADAVGGDAGDKQDGNDGDEPFFIGLRHGRG